MRGGKVRIRYGERFVTDGKKAGIFFFGNNQVKRAFVIFADEIVGRLMSFDEFCLGEEGMKF